MESWLRIEAGQLDRAAVLAADLIELAERHGFDQWRLVGPPSRPPSARLASLGTDDLDPTALSAHIATMTTLLDTWRTVGLNMYVTLYDAVLGRLLIAAGQPEQARARLDTALALAQDTGMCFYDAELLRLRAHTHTDPDARRADISAALELARRQGATLFELRAAGWQANVDQTHRIYLRVDRRTQASRQGEFDSRGDPDSRTPLKGCHHRPSSGHSSLKARGAGGAGSTLGWPLRPSCRRPTRTWPSGWNV